MGNSAYWLEHNIPFAVGQVVWLNRIEFRVVAVTPVSGQYPQGQLILQPVTAKV